MRKEFGQLEGDITVTDHVAMYGLCTGDITVEHGGQLLLYGMCAGNVDVKPGGIAIIHGMCTGNVINSGGKAEVCGMVMGHVEKNAGETIVLSTARVGMAM